MKRTGRSLHQLSALAVSRVETPGHLADGGGLYLQIQASGAKSWVFRFKRAGRAREMGLGPVHTVTLADARVKAAACRKQLLEGLDPIEARDAARASQAVTTAKTKTFSECASAYIAAHRAGWKNEKHISQWENTIATYVAPTFGALPVRSVDTGLVMAALDKIWQTKPETAARVRGRIEAILDWATVKGYRAGDNPARWRGHLDNLLPARSKVRGVRHHPALPYVEIAAFMTALAAQPGHAARALELLILTALRTGEVIGAQPAEFDMAKKSWSIPPARMKMKKAHRVPLSAAALALLEGRLDGEWVFPGGKPREPLSNMAMLELLKRMERQDITVHGFRSTFRDWVAECTTYPNQLAEAALAHAVGDKVEEAYRRGDMFERRRQMMEDWARYCAGESTADVVPINSRRSV